MNIKFDRITQLILIISVAILSYLPAFNNELAVIDDDNLIKSIVNIQYLNLKSIFLPGGEGLYYRPLCQLTLDFDSIVFKCNVLWMHSFNILIHLFNCIAVFYLTIEVQKFCSRSTHYTPFIVTILFANHPITTESVNWISGRTDLIATFFILLSTIWLLKFRSSSRYHYLALSIAGFLAAILSKEFSLFFAPAVLVIYYATGKVTIDRVRLIVYSILTLALFMTARMLAFQSNSFNIKKTIVILSVDYLHTLSMLGRTLAFYLKKIFIPYPLNFGIDDIHYVYEYAGWPLLLLILLILLKNNVVSSMFITGILLMAPAFLISFNQIAWVPYAERYAYTSTPFILLSTVLYARTKIGKNIYSGIIILLGFFVIANGWYVFKRSQIWGNRMELINDIVRQNPDLKQSLLIKGMILSEKHDYQQAIGVLERAEKANLSGYDDRAGLMIAENLSKMGGIDTAIEKTWDVFEKSKRKSTDALDTLLRYYQIKIDRTKGLDKTIYIKKQYEVANILLHNSKNPKWFVFLGEYSEKLHKHDAARKYYKLATQNIPATDPLHAKAVLALQRSNSK